MGDLHVEAEGTTLAEVKTVWALVADANTYAQWGPWNDGGYDPPTEGPSRPGSVQWFRFGRTTSVEKILEVDAPSKIIYTVMRGIPVRTTGRRSPWYRTSPVRRFGGQPRGKTR